MLELYVEPPGVLAQAPSDKPRASLVARYLAAQHQVLINQRHASIPVDATQRRLSSCSMALARGSSLRLNWAWRGRTSIS